MRAARLPSRSNTAASATSGLAASAVSTSSGPTFLPPDNTITSLLRPVTTSEPSLSIRPRSPERNQPSSANTEAVVSLSLK